MSLTLMYITNNSDVALIAQKYGVQRIWVDLEVLGKEERQKNINTVKSTHSIDDIRKIAPLLITSEMLVRINPLNENSIIEINEVIDAGADIIMLPMWKKIEEVQSFIKTIDGRTKTMLLLETKEAVMCLDEILQLPGIDEIHIGLNDLQLSYGLSFMFELLSNGMIEKICRKIQKSGLLYGFGGIAKIGEGMLPAEKIVMEHYRLGSTRAILSRSFCNTGDTMDLSEIDNLFEMNIKKLREFELYSAMATELILLNNKNEVDKCVSSIVWKKGEKKNVGEC